MQEDIVEAAIGTFVKALEEAVADGWRIDYTKNIEARRLSTGLFKVTVVKEEEAVVENDSVGKTGLINAWALAKIEAAEEEGQLLSFAEEIGLTDWKPKNTLGLSKNSLKMSLGLSKAGKKAS
jgi:hypothetical protein